jgi:hypothetical protein
MPCDANTGRRQPNLEDEAIAQSQLAMCHAQQNPELTSQQMARLNKK